MAERQFPERLPAGFREIWTALKAADEDSPSRQALAKRLGTSTHTIQRILVDGDVPDLGRTKNTRVLRAWVRIVTRLAHRLGSDARSWIEAAGIQWDEAVASVVEQTTDRLTAIEAAVRPDLGGEGPGGEVVPEVQGYEFPGEIEVGVVAGGPLDLRVGGSDRPFIETYVSRLVGAIRPDCRIGITGVSADHVIDGMGEGQPISGPESSGKCRIVAGVVDTLKGRMSGLDFVALPGLKMRLSALVLCKRQAEVPPPAWHDCVSPALSKDNKYLVTSGGLAHRFLEGQCGLSEENLIVRETRDPAEIGDTLLSETSLWESTIHRERWVILVDDEETCWRVESALREREDVRRDFSACAPKGTPRDFPAYQVAIAVRAHDREIRDLLRAATVIELFGSAAPHTARLYADLTVVGFMARNMGNLLNPAISKGPHILMDFAGAAGGFRDACCRELMRLLRAEIGGAIERRGLFKTPEALAAQARFLAAQHARNLVPAVWRGDLDMIEALPVRAVPSGLLSVPAMHCLSCSASLLDEEHRGPSDRYCRVCSDEGGNLRPREEVHEILAAWFEHWHGRMEHDEALRQADLFMDRMPAWCKN